MATIAQAPEIKNTPAKTEDFLPCNGTKARPVLCRQRQAVGMFTAQPLA